MKNIPPVDVNSITKTIHEDQRLVIWKPISDLKPDLNNSRTHSKKQIKQIAKSIREFGFNNPILINENNEIIAGHGRYDGAKIIGLQNVPTIKISHLSEERLLYVPVHDLGQGLIRVSARLVECIQGNDDKTGLQLLEGIFSLV